MERHTLGKKKEIRMEGVKSGLQTSSFKVLAGIFAGGGGLSAISPEHMTRVSDFLASLPVGVYGVLMAYIFYRMAVEVSFILRPTILTKEGI